MIFFETPDGGPRWKHIKPHFANIPPDKRQAEMDKFCLQYAPWFFELLTEVDPDTPTVLEEFQIEYLLDVESRFKITNKTRQAGGSLVVSMAKFWKCYRNEATNCDIVSVNLEEAQGKITYIRNLWETLPNRWRHPIYPDNTTSIGFHGRGNRQSVIRSKAASSGVRGGRKDIVFDEAHHLPNFKEMFVAALPATIRNDGGYDAVSTPNGQQGRYYEIWSNAEGKYSSWSRHSFVWIDVDRFCIDRAKAKKAFEEDFQGNVDALVNNGELYDAFASDALKEVAESLTAEEFLQEFCGKFVDESTAFYSYAIIDACRKHKESQPLPSGKLDTINVLVPWSERPEDNEHQIFMGIDFAEGKKGGDSTSIQIVEKINEKDLRLRHSADLGYGSGYDNFDKQLHEISRLIHAFRPTRVSVDETGLGRKIAADLKRDHGGKVEGITFGLANKEEMALNLKFLLERQQLWLPWDNKALRSQIHGIKRKVTAQGNLQYSGEPHDDMFWALCLACKGQSKRGFQIITLDDNANIYQIA